MCKESLFKLIREEEVIIWIGAGLSTYAGYPTGKRLGEILLENLSDHEKSLISNGLTLPYLAEEFFRIKGNNRNQLIKILSQTFINIKPQSTKLHDLLSIIPHFKTIITTNYDTLIEDSYKERAQVLYSQLQIPYIAKDKIQVFKVHGDLLEPKSIIITKSDYENFFKSEIDKNLYWTVIKERIATKNVLFLGYNLEDINVSVIFDRITEVLGPDKKESFLIAPQLQRHKVTNLISKGVHYIDLNAEDFFSELIQEIKTHIIEDLEAGKTSAETFRDFLLNNNLLPELRTEDNRFRLRSLNGLDGNIEGKFNFTVKNDPEYIQNINEYLKGKKFGDFEIANDKLVDANVWLGGLKMPFQKGISKILLKSIPKKKGIIDIKFDDGSEFTNIPAEAYGSTSLIEIHLNFKSAIIKLSFEVNDSFPGKFQFNYTHSEICKRVKDEIELFTFLKNLAEGMPFKVFIENGKVYSNSLSISSSLLVLSRQFLNYFNNLRTIENYYNLHFTDFNFNSIDKTSFNKTEILIKAYLKESVEYNWNEEFTMDIIDTESVIDHLKKINNEDVSLFGFENTETEIELHEHLIKIGYKRFEIIEPLITNLQSIIEKNEKVIHVISKKKILKVSYTEHNETK